MNCDINIVFSRSTSSWNTFSLLTKNIFVFWEEKNSPTAWDWDLRKWRDHTWERDWYRAQRNKFVLRIDRWMLRTLCRTHCPWWSPLAFCPLFQIAPFRNPDIWLNCKQTWPPWIDERIVESRPIRTWMRKCASWDRCSSDRECLSKYRRWRQWVRHEEGQPEKIVGQAF